MKYFYLYVLLLCCIIIAVSSFTHYYKYNILKETEPFTNNKTVILLGDSILKNNSYVKNGKGIDDILREKTNNNLYCYAKDDSTITDIYGQLNSIPDELNKKDTTIFLSVGGNDILTHFGEKDVNTSNIEILNPMFGAYTKLIKSIQAKMDESRLVLINIYYPVNIKYAQYRPVLKEWNKMLSDFALTNNIPIIEISNILIEESDFTLNIEPSESGGEKIANLIISI